jgi:hypothetical protein
MIPLLPLLKYWKIGAAVAVIAAASYAGYTYSNNKWEAKFAKIEKEAAELREQNQILATKSEQITIKEVTKYVDRIRVVREKAEQIIKEVPVYVTQEADNRCTITDGFVWVHDAAATNTDIQVPNTTGDPDASTTNIRLSDVAKTVTINYSKYHELVEQLTALQNWILEQERLYNKK